MVIINVSVYGADFRFSTKNVCIRNGVYEYPASDEPKLLPDEEVINGTGLKLIPRLTDVHFHGCVGYDLCDGTTDAIRHMAEYEYSVGLANICPATMTLPIERIKNICRTAAGYAAAQDGPTSHSRAALIGINLEGPFISPKKTGAQDPKNVIEPKEELIKEFLSCSEGLAKLITIAPEVGGALSCISRQKDKIHFSVGHTAADYDEARAGFDAGADHVTHLFNAMEPMTHRAPGVIGAAAENKNVMAELICDGIHIHPSAVRAAFDLFGAERIVLISDSMRACGMEDGEYDLGGMNVKKTGNEARLSDGTLAGSVTNLYDCMKTAISMGIPAEDAIRAAAYNPLVSIGMEQYYPMIEDGRTANALLVNENWTIVRSIY